MSTAPIQQAPAIPDELPSPGFFRQIVEGSGVPMIVFECRDRLSVVQFVNESFTRRTGYTAAALSGSNWWALHAGEKNAGALAQLREAMGSARELQIHLHCRCRDGSRFWSRMHVSPLFDERGVVQRHVAVMQDLSAEYEELDALERDAHHDVLTGLPNRRLLADRFHAATAQGRRSTRQLALALIDLDGFKQVNDTLGHRAGDEVLQLTAMNLVQTMRADDTVARLGGDEFAVLIHSALHYESLQAVEARIRAAVARPAMIHGHALRIGCSVGIGLFPTDGMDFEALVEQADRRMYARKPAGAQRASAA
jgi:diguanylate cyclase (GGDEF)-like protein/PAS domain S-box-containing protein